MPVVMMSVTTFQQLHSLLFNISNNMKINIKVSPRSHPESKKTVENDNNSPRNDINDENDDAEVTPEEYIKSFIKRRDPNLSEHENDARAAQYLSSVGLYEESLIYYKKAYEVLNKLKIEFTWEGLFCRMAVQYASVLDYLNNIEDAENVYNSILEIGPSAAMLGDYAVFLHKRRRDYDIADRYYSQSIAEFSHQSSIILKYAGFLRHIKKDINKAEKYYKRSIEINPNNADAVGTYASFLHGMGSAATNSNGNNSNTLDKIDKLYQRAVQIDQTHPNNMCNYGLFLSEERHDYKTAEEMYIKVLAILPDHSNTLYNYGVMLDSHLNRKEEAETMYRRAVKASPRQPFALYNLAVLLEERLNIMTVLNDPNNNGGEEEDKVVAPEYTALMEETYSFYHRAMDANPKDPVTVADLGRYLVVVMKEIQKGEKLLSSALELDDSCAIALYHLGILNNDCHKNIKVAEELFRKLRKYHPKHIGGMQYLTAVLQNPRRRKGSPLDVNTIDELMDLYEQIITLIQQNKADATSSVLEYTTLTAESGNSRQKLRAIGFLESADVGGSDTIDLQSIEQRLKS